MHNKPPTIQTEIIMGNDPHSLAIVPGFAKIPVPIVLPTTTAIAMIGPSTRGSSFVGGVESELTDAELLVVMAADSTTKTRL